MSTARNVAIILVLAAAVAFIPGGGTTAASWARSCSTLIMVSLVFFVVSLLPRAPRSSSTALGDRWRGLLYGAVGVVVLALAALPRLKDHRRRHARRGRRCSAAPRTRSTLVWRHYREYA